jgi:hypothetical protein
VADFEGDPPARTLGGPIHVRVGLGCRLPFRYRTHIITTNAESILWFGISGGTLAFAISLLWQRYVKRTPHAVQSRGSFLMFAILALIFSVGAFFAGLVTM